MDWNSLIKTANRLLRTAARMGEPDVQLRNLFEVINQGSPDWHSDGTTYRLMHQAIDLLEHESLIELTSYGSVRLSQRGRAVQRSTIDSWTPDPTSARIRAWIEIQELQEQADLARPKGDLTLSRLTVSQWRQFDEVDVRFHPRLTVLTGANAAGKTTLLNLLAPHFNWQGQFVTRGRQQAATLQGDHQSVIGELSYSNGARTLVVEPPINGVATAQASYTNMHSVAGIFISSHRSISSYQRLESLPARFSEAETLLAQFASEVQVRYSGGTSNHPPLFRMKEALVAAALHGYGNQVVRRTESGIKIWEGYQQVLKRFLPSTLGFREFAVENGDLIFVTDSGDFPLEAASGGLSAMLELSWQVFLRSEEARSFTVCIDEPENHLHPQLQRIIIPSLLEAFPGVSFIVATHSPFVVTATRDCYVYALDRGERPRIRSRLVNDLNAAGTADETLQRVLGLDTPLPLWVQSALGAALENFPAEATAADLRHLRERLSSLGLERQFPSAIAAIDGSRRD